MSRTNGEYSVVGTRPVRHDGVDKVTGRAIYGVDARMPGMLHGKVLRSPHAHARIISIDTDGAAKLDGVRAVMTAADLPDPGAGLLEANESGMQRLRYKSASLMARDKVLYEGHAVAAVAAVSPHVAEAALDQIVVEYEVLPHVLDVREAMRADAPLLHDDLFTETGGVLADTPSNVATHQILEEGDIQRGFAEAALVLEREYSAATVHQGYIEPLNALAYWNQDGRLIVEVSSQGHFAIRNELSNLLRYPISKIRVIPAEIGGGFGGKTTVYLEPLAAVLSRKAGRPVKFSMDRADILRAGGPAPGGRMRAKIGVTAEGRMTAAQVELAFEAGGYPGSSVGGGSATAIGPYSLENFRIDAYDVLVNKPKTHAYRAPGAPQAEFAVESLVDEICDELGMDPFDFRMLNASKEGDLRSDGTRFPKVGNIETITAARATEHWQSPHPSNGSGSRGRGIASGYWMNGVGVSSAVARLNPDGTVTLLEGSVDIGGTRTAVAIQLAETLGIPIEDVDPIVPDTDSIPYTSTTGGSRVAHTTGIAAVKAATDLERQILDGLADYWDAAPSEIRREDGVYRQGDDSLTFREAAAVLDEEDVHPTGKATVAPDKSGNTFAVHIADVEVDKETGKITVLRYTAVQDAGTAIYPPYVEGQMEGGVVQGIGWALNEEYAYSDQGKLLNASLLDYRMPTTLDVPMIDTEIVEIPHADHPFGARGVGEIPIVPPLATMANAIADAVGVRMRDLPASPRKVQAALAAKAVDSA